MIKPDRWIREWGRNGGVTPFEEGQVNAASYDVRVSDHWICPTRDPEEFRAPGIKLFPGEVVLASTLEYVRIPRDVACDLKLSRRSAGCGSTTRWPAGAIPVSRGRSPWSSRTSD